MCRRAVVCTCLHCLFFFFNDTAPTEIYTLSLHDALPIFGAGGFLDEGGNRFDRHPRGDLAGDVTAHSVGDDEEANLWMRRMTVFVAAAPTTRVGADRPGEANRPRHRRRLSPSSRACA